MAQVFVQTLFLLHLFGHLAPVLNDIVEHFGLLARRPAHVARVIHDHQSNGSRQRKQRVPPSAHLSDGHGRCTDKGRVRAGHIAAAHHTFQIQVPVCHEVDQCFNHLRNEPSEDCQIQGQVSRQEACMIHTAPFLSRWGTVSLISYAEPGCWPATPGSPGWQTHPERRWPER